MSNIEVFQEEYPTLESYWRSIILFGRNVASYKFALAKSLLEIVPTGKTEITLEELANPFSKNLCEHMLQAPKQATSRTSQFLNTCKDYNNDAISYDQLIEVTRKKGFVNVIDAFHNVNNDELPIKFYEKDYTSSSKKIILTDEIFRLTDIAFYDNLMNEAESRWNLVETAWELNISKNLLNIQYDDHSKLLFVGDQFRRKDVTSARAALNGYQKGKCFYCFDDITTENKNEAICDVDHFFPHTLQSHMKNVNLDGVWNLVLACKTCNRGEKGKFAKIPTHKYLERLNKRNEFLIESHHPLRETLMQQTGKTAKERQSFLQKIDKQAINLLIHRWEIEQIGKEGF